jgi:hypothetical protein
MEKALHKVCLTFFRFFPHLLQHQRELMSVLADNHFRTRAMLKQFQGKPIQVLFVCHEPAMWNMFESVYREMEQDPGFSPLVVALPYRHETLPHGQYKDAGMMKFCEANGFRVVLGYDKENNTWLNPASLAPDYVFFQQPYSYHLHQMWSMEMVAMIARVCYIPYATFLAKGEIAAVLHPESLFRLANLFFMENPWEKKSLEEEFKDRRRYGNKKIILTGYPKLDYLVNKNGLIGGVWKRGMSNDIKRILWTPRWRTTERTCHFFDYKDYFLKFCKKHPDIDFVFRPHPLFWQNFAKTGELPLDEQKQMQLDYGKSLNMSIDNNAGYADTFLTSDMLISDFSSMIFEYFATGKPIIYTHRKNVFNEYGVMLSAGLYWVRNNKELDATISMLLAGNDPLRKKREELMKTMFFMPETGAGRMIKEYLKVDYKN